MLYVVVHHDTLFHADADAWEYLIGVFDTKENAQQAREKYFATHPDIYSGIHSISITPVELNTYNENLEFNIPLQNLDNEWVEREI